MAEQDLISLVREDVEAYNIGDGQRLTAALAPDVMYDEKSDTIHAAHERRDRMMRTIRPRMLWLAVLILAVVTTSAGSAGAEPERHFRAVFAGPTTTFSVPGRPGVLRLVLEMVSRRNNFHLQTLSVEKFVDPSVDPFPANGRPEVLLSDTTYIFTDANGDTLVLNTIGYGTTSAPTREAEEIFSVNPVESTGRFAGATGAGRIHSDIVLRPNPVVDDDIPDGDNVKTFTGEITLAE